MKNLFLIGYRGTGKTTVARILGEKIGWGWIDADAALEERYGRSIRRIFEEDGEAGFREKEMAILEELCRAHNHVIATGGGVVLREANLQRLRTAGRVVWLTADARTLWQRLQADEKTHERRPPLLSGGLEEIEQLLRVRTPLYQCCADFTVDTSAASPEAIAGRIFELLENENERERVRE